MLKIIKLWISKIWPRNDLKTCPNVIVGVISMSLIIRLKWLAKILLALHIVIYLNVKFKNRTLDQLWLNRIYLTLRSTRGSLKSKQIRKKKLSHVWTTFNTNWWTSWRWKYFIRILRPSFLSSPFLERKMRQFKVVRISCVRCTNVLASYDYRESYRLKFNTIFISIYIKNINNI